MVKHRALILAGVALFSTVVCALTVVASDLNTIGVTALRALQPDLTGAGIRVAQPEALYSLPDGFEVNPATLGLPISLFTWISTNGAETNFPNNLGSDSSHADQVGQNFYSDNFGVAPGVAHVDSYEADYFIAYLIASNAPISDPVVNQSFIDTDFSDEPSDDSVYDDYVAINGTVICTAAGNGGPIYPFGTAYNLISVGDYEIGATSSFGPTSDGRSKPDLVAPGSVTSLSTPTTSGAATVLLQAALRGDGGGNTTVAADRRTLKALLMNGAVKQYDWSHSDTAPLDYRYGSGLLNIYYSYLELAAGMKTPSESFVGSEAPVYGHPISSPLGWDFETFGTALGDFVNHYCFDTTNANGGPSTLTATLVWEIGYQMTNVNHLELFLYNATNGTLVAQSVSPVDNIQHLYVPNLPAGRYDLEVVKPQAVLPSATETYALAFQFFPVTAPLLTFKAVGTNATLSWPATPTDFVLQQTSNLTPPIAWTATTNFELLSNGLVKVNATLGGPGTFYRLAR